jgi:hypothetical protein
MQEMNVITGLECPWGTRGVIIPPDTPEGPPRPDPVPPPPPPGPVPEPPRPVPPGPAPVPDPEPLPPLPQAARKVQRHSHPVPTRKFPHPASRKPLIAATRRAVDFFVTACNACGFPPDEAPAGHALAPTPRS